MRTSGAGRLLVLAVLVVLLSAGCSPDPVAPPTPSPVAPSPTPTENAQEREQRIAYAAAEKSYRDFRTEFRRVTGARGAEKATSVMTRTGAGPYLAEGVKTVRAYRTTGSYTKGRGEIGYVRPAGYESNSLLLDVCEDERGVQAYNSAGKQLGTSDILKLRLEVRHLDGSWKVWSASGSKANSCA